MKRNFYDETTVKYVYVATPHSKLSYTKELVGLIQKMKIHACCDEDSGNNYKEEYEVSAHFSEIARYLKTPTYALILFLRFDGFDKWFDAELRTIMERKIPYIVVKEDGAVYTKWQEYFNEDIIALNPDIKLMAEEIAYRLGLNEVGASCFYEKESYSEFDEWGIWDDEDEEEDVDYVRLDNKELLEEIGIYADDEYLDIEYDAADLGDIKLPLPKFSMVSSELVPELPKEIADMEDKWSEPRLGPSIWDMHFDKRDFKEYMGDDEVLHIPQNMKNLLGVKKHICELYLPLGMQSIGEAALYKNKLLTSVYGASTLKYVYGYAFYGCESLEHIILSDRIKMLPMGSFSRTGLVYLKLPKNLVTIGPKAFAYSKNLTFLSIPEGVEDIGKFAFGGCIGLNSIVLPSTLSKLNKLAFAGCKNLKHIYCNFDKAKYDELTDGYGMIPDRSDYDVCFVENPANVPKN